MSFEPVEAPETQDEPETESAVAEPESVERAETTDDFGYPEGFDINGVPDEYREYIGQIEKQFKGHYTKKTQELAEQRKTYEAAQDLATYWDQLQTDPEAQAALYMELQGLLEQQGYWNEEEVEPEQEIEEESEFHDPRLDPILEQMQAQAEQDQYIEYLDSMAGLMKPELEAAARELGRDFTDEELDIVTNYAMTFQVEKDGQMVPNTSGAITHLKKMYADHLNQYIESKKAPQVVGGVPGSEKLNLNDDEVRRQAMLDMVEAQRNA